MLYLWISSWPYISIIKFILILLQTKSDSPSINPIIFHNSHCIQRRPRRIAYCCQLL